MAPIWAGHGLFKVRKGSAFRFLEYLELIQNHLKPKDFFRYCETLLFQPKRISFILNTLSIIYNTLFKHFRLLEIFSETFISQVPSRFHR